MDSRFLSPDLHQLDPEGRGGQSAVQIEKRRRDYSGFRPLSSLDNATPEEFAARAESKKTRFDRDLEMVQDGLAY